MCETVMFLNDNESVRAFFGPRGPRIDGFHLRPRPLRPSFCFQLEDLFPSHGYHPRSPASMSHLLVHISWVIWRLGHDSLTPQLRGDQEYPAIEAMTVAWSLPLFPHSWEVATTFARCMASRRSKGERSEEFESAQELMS